MKSVLLLVIITCSLAQTFVKQTRDQITSCQLSSSYLNTKYKVCINCEYEGNSSECTTICQNSSQVLINGKCYSCGNNCQTCSLISGSLQCVECEANYTRFGNICLSFTLASKNCAQFSQNPSLCTQCQPGYYLQLTNKNLSLLNPCLPCSVPNCMTCSSSIDCAECFTGFSMKVTESGGRQCTTGTCVSPQMSDSSGNCTLCISGYFKSSSTCIACNTKIARCISCTSETSCQACETGYTLNNNLCVLNEANCAVQQINSSNLASCTQCLIGYYTVAKSAGLNICQACPTPSVQCDTSLDTSSITVTTPVPSWCQDGYQLIPGKNNNETTCVQTSTITGCAALNPSNTKQCALCNNTYGLASDTQLCVQCGTGCSKCSAKGTSATCTECQGTTTNGYFLSNGSCLSCGQNALTCKSATQAVTCVAGITLVQGENNVVNCVASKIQGCSNENSSGKCTQCFAGYNLMTENNTQICVQGSTLCKQYNSNMSQCTSCENGYYPYGKGCQAIDNCESANSNGCAICDYEFENVNGVCATCTDGQTFVCRGNSTSNILISTIIAVLTLVIFV